MTGLQTPPSPWVPATVDGRVLLQLALAEGIDIAELLVQQATVTGDLADAAGNVVYDQDQNQVPRARTAVTDDHDSLASTYNDHAADGSAHHNRYTDGEARTAVDGSNVAVAEANSANLADAASNADNADQLGGQDPSFYETPNNTANSKLLGGYTVVADIYHDFDFGESKTFDFSFNNTVVDGLRWSGTIDDTSFNVGPLSYNTKNGEENIEPQELNSGSVTMSRDAGVGGGGNFTLEIHVVSNNIHNHTL